MHNMNKRIYICLQNTHVGLYISPKVYIIIYDVYAYTLHTLHNNNNNICELRACTHNSYATQYTCIHRENFWFLVGPLRIFIVGGRKAMMLIWLIARACVCVCVFCMFLRFVWQRNKQTKTKSKMFRYYHHLLR